VSEAIQSSPHLLFASSEIASIKALACSSEVMSFVDELQAKDSILSNAGLKFHRGDRSPLLQFSQTEEV